ncbi:MAG: nuclear transport factor 2 family protein [Solirubrobacterales bacterium]|nr:nuclear transport factor 2 family protein [Solirubrobacterales bacterium]
MTPRDLFDRHVRLLEAGDLEGLLGQYHDDAVLLRFDRAVRGKGALREYLAGYLAQHPRVREVLQYADADDLISYQAVLELGGEEVRAHGTYVLRGERISRQVWGLFPQTSGAARGRAQVQVDLEPYTAWSAHPVPDPRTAGREAIGRALLEIVDAEGPILADRAYRLYVKASGGKALTSIARAPLSGAAYRLRQAGAIEFTGDAVVLRPAGVPEVRVRDLGPRELHEVPMDEVAELMRRLRAAGAAELPRAVLDAYGLVRMTAKAEEFLREAEEVSAG